MAKLLRTKCPQCNAPLKIDPGAEVVTCEFCQHSAVVQRGEQPPQRTAATVNFGTINLTQAQKERARRVLLIVILATSLVPIIGVGSCLVCVLAGGEQAARTLRVTAAPGQSSAGDEDKQAAEIRAKANQVMAKALSQMDNMKARQNRSMQQMLARLKKHVPATGIQVKADDLSHVDGLELFHQARKAALEIDPHARLTSIVLPRVVGGAVDVAAGDRAHFTFAYSYRDEKKPPGEDTVKGRIHVSLHAGAFTVTRDSASGRTLAEPQCSTAKVWQTATRSGVPENAVAKIHFYRGFSRGAGSVWSVRVDGHPEHRREISGRTCALIKSYAR